MTFSKVFNFVVATVFLMTLCGCNGDFYTKPHEKRFVSAIGIDKTNTGLRVSAEAVAVLGEGKTSTEVLSGEGADVDGIFAEIEAKSKGRLSFSHCAVLVLDDQLLKKDCDEIMNTFVKGRIPLSVRVVTSRGAESLLNVKKQNGGSVGYEISDLLRQMGRELGFAEHIELYEIATARMQNLNVYALPRFEKEGGAIRFQGMEVFVDDKNKTALNYDQSVGYATIRNIFEGGNLICEDGVVKIRSASVKISARLENEKLKIDLKVRSSPYSEELVLVVQNSIKSFEEDVFGIGNEIESRYPKVWESVKGEYQEFYRNADITVRGEES